MGDFFVWGAVFGIFAALAGAIVWSYGEYTERVLACIEAEMSWIDHDCIPTDSVYNRPILLQMAE